AEDAGVLPAHVAGAHVLMPLETVAALREVEEVPRPFDVDGHADLSGHGEVVDGREVVDLPHFSRDRVSPIAEPEIARGEIAGHELDPAAERLVGALERSDG